MRALITGIAGFAGSHLAEELLAHGHEVAGIKHSDDSLANLDGFMDGVELFSADVRDAARLREILAAWEPDIVFHLAAISFVPEAEGAPKRVFEVNLMGTVNLVEAMRVLSRMPHLVFVSTSEVYAPAPFALIEASPVRPRNLYAASKYAAELFIAGIEGLDACVFRSFNHIGPRQRPSFVVSSFARQVALMEKGKKEPVLEVGNLEAARDFTDVRDIVRAYRMAAELEATGTFNLCSGRLVKIRTLVETFKRLARTDFDVRVRSELVRSRETMKSFGSYEKAAETFGWQPEIALEKSLADTLDYWRARV